MRFSMRRNGEEMATMRVEHVLTREDIGVAALCWGDELDEVLAMGSEELWEAARKLMRDNPLKMYYPDDWSEDDLDRAREHAKETLAGADACQVRAVTG